MSIHAMEEIKRSVGDVREWLKDQRFTDDDREPDSNINISIEQLNRALALMLVVEKEIERLRADRDKARRSVCYSALLSDYKKWKPEDVDAALRLISAQQGWNCFNEVKP